MKFIVTLMLMLTTGMLYAQRITGMLMGEVSRMPLAHATVSVGGNAVLSNAYGVFTINVPNTGDSIRINCAGYKYHAFKPTTINSRDTVIIYLKPTSFALKEVVIKSQRNVKADSLRTRKDFAKAFAYKAPTIADVMVKVDPTYYVPYNYIDAPNNTTSIVGFDVLQLISFLGKKKSSAAYLQKTLLRAENNNYVEQAFSPQKITGITGLKGDSLRYFMDTYRPMAAQVKKMTEYEMVLYIQKSYADFKLKKP
jgi:hypothetical protein